MREYSMVSGDAHAAAPIDGDIEMTSPIEETVTNDGKKDGINQWVAKRWKSPPKSEVLQSYGRRSLRKSEEVSTFDSLCDGINTERETKYVDFVAIDHIAMPSLKVVHQLHLHTEESWMTMEK